MGTLASIRQDIEATGDEASSPAHAVAPTQSRAQRLTFTPLLKHTLQPVARMLSTKLIALPMLFL
jgi:hypothetical protein